MAKAPAKRRIPKSTRRSTKPNKGPCDCLPKGKKSGKVKAGKKTSSVPTPNTVDCFPACGETGVWGIIWKDAAGTPRCLPFTGTAEKYLKGDANGPFWANA